MNAATAHARPLTTVELLERLRVTEQRLAASLEEQARLEARLWLVTKGRDW